MAFDQATRNRLQRFVTDARRALEEEFTRQLQNDFGMDPVAGTITPIESLRHINDQQRETARILRDTLDHYCAGGDMDMKAGLDRIVREQAFTVLNRLSALRMAEARGLLIETVGNGFQAKGFQLYARLAATGLGETGDAYRVYLHSVFDELSLDLPGLFDRYSPQGRLFPGEAALLQVLALINHGEIEPLWAEDETIGWIYQYFNSKEERKAMRDASQAPRNSRELAVRNQFFTPRYVVEFLVDNTLGRLWFNWTGGQTGLRERCHYLLVKPDEKPEPASRIRDPRTIKLLDPACGSMHFGLYAFDLFAEIYREAWTWEQTNGPGSLDTETGGSADLKPLSQTYADQEALLHDVPRLIVEHNIYGVDIDARAAQIAALALWLRAQRAWHDAGVKAKDRPQIGRGQVVAAVAPPAEVELRQRFMAELDPLDAELFEQTLFMLKGLPELGVLLQVEKELPALIRKVFGEHGDLFHDEDMEQWQKAEARLRGALADYAHAAKSTFQGRLFAEDALQGLRMIDHCREVFDVVVMNPPFGSPPNSQTELKEWFPNSGRDIYAMFLERAMKLKRQDGRIGAILPRTGLFIGTMSEFRDNILIDGGLDILADLGKGVLDDATIRTACYVLGREERPLTILRVGNIPIREARLSELCAKVTRNEYDQDNFEVDPRKFQKLPASAIAYWMPSHITDEISKMKRVCDYADVRQGIATGDNFRFLRLFCEISGQAGSYSFYSKGGQPVPFFSDETLYVKSENFCAEMKAYAAANYGSASRTIKNEDTFFKPGITYSQVNDAGLKFRAHPSGSLYDMKGPVLFVRKDISVHAMLAFLNSMAVEDFMRMMTDGRQWHVTALKEVPFPPLSEELERKLHELSLKAVESAFLRTAIDETCHHFRFKDRLSVPSVNEGQLQGVADAIDAAVWSAFGLSSSEVKEVSRQRLLFLEREIDNSDVAGDESELEIQVSSPLSIAIGIAFGRFDWRLATGEREAPPEPDPFDPLPAQSPGMLPEGTAPFHSHSGILVDDQGHPHDLPRLIEEVLARVQADAPADLRRWLQRDFFSIHLKQYSKSRRKAPIYWPISTNSGSYTLWLYYPALTSQTLYTAVNDFIEGPNGKLAQIGRDISGLREKGSARSSQDEKRYEVLQALELELVELRDTLLQIAPTYHPNHDDGVQITAAPLWKLFRHKQWQKILKDTWAKLEKGDYDWAHLAMAYWPDRVREKCKTDKSLAIAHDLEHLYVQPEPKAAKPRGRKKDTV